METFAQFGVPAGKIARAAIAAVMFGAAPASAHRIEKHFSVEDHPVIVLHNSSGTVVIHSWQKPEVQVVADHASPKVEVDAEQKGNLVELKTHVLSEDLSPDDLKADYEVTVPEEAELQIHNDSGSVRVERVFGDLMFETVAADVNLERTAGNLVIKTVGGPFTCEQCAGRIEANSISGPVNLIRTESSNIRAQTSSGDILLDSDLRPNGIYYLKTYSGGILVRFSPDDSFDLSATSIYGKVENEANLKPPAHDTRHPSQRFARSLFGTYNDGKARVELSSFSGTIQIRKRE